MLVMAVGLVAGPAAAQDQGAIVSQSGGGYSLAPGDLVRISVWGREEYSGQFQVDEDGNLHYPVLGEINTTDLTVRQLRDTLRTGLEQLFANPFVTITPLFRVAVLGQVNRPGLYTVDPTLSVLDLVALAGGATEAGNTGSIRVFRGGAASQFNYEDEAIRARSLGEIGVRSGDEIMVPRKFFARQDWWILLQFLTLSLTAATFIVTVSQ
jgi:polysaccharide export outer membrane protein